MVAEVIDNTTSRGRTLRFLFDGDYDEFKAALYKLGETPLPKWIRPKVEPIDEERYQTIFAKNEGAVAAPTAGLHFSKHLMKRLEIKGVDMTFLTLHVGLGNFRTVDVEDLTKHKMDSEQVVIPERDGRGREPGQEGRWQGVRRRHDRDALGREFRVDRGIAEAFRRVDDKFIFSPYEFSVANCMITNFHLPYSTQLMMVAAFAGYDALMSAYDVAKKEKYRFGTYGDAMLIL